MVEEQSKAEAADIKEKILNNNIVKEEIEKVSAEKVDHAIAKHDAKLFLDSNPLQGMTHYKGIESSHFEDLEKEVNNAKENISEISLEKLQSIKQRVMDAASIEAKLAEKAANYVQPSVETHSSFNGLPETLEDILKDSSKYENARIGNSNLYKTSLDEKSYDASLIGKWEDVHSAKYMKEEVLADYNNMLERNYSSRNAHKII